MNIEILKKFVLDPQWPSMQEMIESFFEQSMDVADIDTSLSPETVHAEVIARKKIKKCLEDMTAAFEGARNNANDKKISFR